MSLEQLASPIEGDNPVGVDCETQIQSQHFDLMSQYLAERAQQKNRERVKQVAENAGEDSETIENASFEIEAGRRKLVGLEGIIKDAAKISPVTAERVAVELFDRSVALLTERGKDLRVVPFLAVAQVQREGIAGYADVLALACSLLDSFPDTVYPQPGPDEPSDFWERDSVVAELLTSPKLSALLGSFVVLDAKQAGRLTIADVTGGDLGDPNVDEAPQSDVDIAADEVGPDAVKAIVDQVSRIVESSEALLLACPTVHLTGTVPDRLAGMAQRITGQQTQEDGEVEAFGGQGTGVGGGGELRSREDARRTIRELIRYFERAEPSHPAPLLLARADRLLGMSFAEIIEDMAPGGAAEVALISGIKATE